MLSEQTACSSYEIIIFSSRRAPTILFFFFTYSLMKSLHVEYLFLFFFNPRSFTSLFVSLVDQVSDTEEAGPRYQEEGTPGRLSRATAAAAGSKLPASGPHYITLLLC